MLHPWEVLKNSQSFAFPGQFVPFAWTTSNLPISIIYAYFVLIFFRICEIISILLLGKLMCSMPQAVYLYITF